MLTREEADRFVAEWVAAWNAHDVEALLDFMTDDGVFQASVGPAPFGTTAVGREALRRAYSAIWQTYPDAQWTNGRHFAAGNNACSEWIFIGTKADGTKVEVQGCDLFTLRNGKIAVKNSFRKQVQ